LRISAFRTSRFLEKIPFEIIKSLDAPDVIELKDVNIRLTAIEAWVLSEVRRPYSC